MLAPLDRAVTVGDGGEAAPVMVDRVVVDGADCDSGLTGVALDVSGEHAPELGTSLPVAHGAAGEGAVSAWATGPAGEVRVGRGVAGEASLAAAAPAPPGI